MPVPYYQGSLEGTCGAYSMTNSFVRVLALQEEEQTPFAEALLGQIIKKGFPAAGLSLDEIVDGIEHRSLKPLLKNAAEFVNANFESGYMGIRQYNFGECAKRDWFAKLKKLFDTQKPGKFRLAVIIGWDSLEEGHWTCVKQVTFDPNKNIGDQRPCLRLVDSSKDPTPTMQYSAVRIRRKGQPIAEHELIDPRLFIVYYSVEGKQAADTFLRPVLCKVA